MRTRLLRTPDPDEPRRFKQDVESAIKQLAEPEQYLIPRLLLEDAFTGNATTVGFYLRKRA